MISQTTNMCYLLVFGKCLKIVSNGKKQKMAYFSFVRKNRPSHM